MFDVEKVISDLDAEMERLRMVREGLVLLLDGVGRPRPNRAPRGSVTERVFEALPGTTATISTKLPDVKRPSISSALGRLEKAGRIVKEPGHGGAYSVKPRAGKPKKKARKS